MDDMNRREAIQKIVTGVAAMVGVVAAAAIGHAAQTQPNQPQRGYGQCRKCDCSKFRGSGNTCKCDHSFYDHQV